MALSLILDLVVVLILLVSAGVSFFRGIIKETLTIFGFAGGFLAAFFAGGTVSDFVKTQFNLTGENVGKLFGMIPYDMVATIASYGGIFVVVFLSLQLLSHFISSAARAVGLGPVDRTLGVFFGLARGVLLLGILYLPFHLILPDENKETWFGKSQTHTYLEATANWLSGFLPKQDDKPEEDPQTTREKLKEMNLLKSNKEGELGLVQPARDETQEQQELYKQEDRQKLDAEIQKAE